MKSSDHLNCINQSMLGDLFSKWKDLQNTEDIPVWCSNSVFPFPCKLKGFQGERSYPHNFAKSFCPDGFIQYIDQSAKTILFLAKEANVYRNNNLSPELCDTFWLLEQWSNIKDDHVFKEYIRHFSIQCCGSENVVNIAYMNINKRGGYGSCNMTRLENYAKHPDYRNMILKEIAIIDPDFIICCSTAGIVQRHFLAELKALNPDIAVYDCYHPTSRPSVRFSKFEPLQ